MSRWLKNVNALLENLDNQVEETVEEHNFNRTISAAARNGGGDGDEAGAVEGLLLEEAQGVDDILAKRGLLGSPGGEEDYDDADGDNNVGGEATDGYDNGNIGQNADSLKMEGGPTDVDNKLPSEPEIVGTGPKDNIDDSKQDSGVEGVAIESIDGGLDDAVSEEINFDGDSSANGEGSEQKKDLFGDADVVPAAENKDTSKVQTKEAAPTSVNATPVGEGTSNNVATVKPKQQAPSSSNLSAPPKSNNNNTASLKELRKLRRHVLQLNSDLESAEREIEAQRQELDRAASRMERDRSRHKQEKESTDASHKAEIAALAAAHERVIQQLKESNDNVVQEMESRVMRAEQQRAKEGGERDAELVDALERERMSVGSAARLQEEKTTMNERITSLTTDVSRLETRLEHATSQMELASERERSAEEQLDKALSVHSRQLGVRQRRESELEQTVADLGAALVVAKNKVEAAMRAGINLDGEEMLRRSDSSGIIPEDPLDLKAQLQDSQDEIETLQAQLSLERQRCSTLHDELLDLSKEQADELSGAHAKQRQYERKISDLTTMVTKLQDDAFGGSRSTDAVSGKKCTTSTDLQSSGDEKKETDHLRKEITSLSEKIFEQQSKIDHGRGEISTLKNRLRSALLRAETAEKSLETANQRLIMMDVPMSGMSSADEEMGLRGRVVKKRPRKGFRKTSKVESIRSALGLHPGRYPSGGWQETIASLLDTFDTLAVDLGSHFRSYPMSRMAFMIYLLILHMWAFFLLVYHAHAQGTGGGGDHHGPEALLRSYRHIEQVPKLLEGAAVNVAP
mmetsp:Transcript_21399/g.46466  ORF Transcript_21399/g.46466 Transcript_21399/m.46466 type:complete len:802 (-) Transcript_21399:136-2541(-)|eukprot:CAMPEP_0172315714 /NCGR_PEP_ID=MMETSP1058-20130122/26059_1 /TAXON_ID=83371 /ORGANISM="Detonula confervacea, Strain CCMP 353" /LENGTH=801 /DNA_ID=CAMNT_0013029855 /DNA_START=56 /DNA_END=2461 /DNA_ORIENTATION=-